MCIHNDEIHFPLKWTCEVHVYVASKAWSATAIDAVVLVPVLFVQFGMLHSAGHTFLFLHPVVATRDNYGQELSSALLPGGFGAALLGSLV